MSAIDNLPDSAYDISQATSLRDCKELTGQDAQVESPADPKGLIQVIKE
jgi:hypothetical protein